MAKPNQPKDTKPKENEELVKLPIDNNIKLVMINIISTVLICILLIGVNYLLQENLLNKKLEALDTNRENVEEESADADADGVQKGIVVDLGDFILNLSDPNQKKYLKVNVALEVTRTATDPQLGGDSGKKEKEGEGMSVDPAAALEAEMAQYKPAIRDVVISNFSSKTADEVATTAGKELVKEQIKEDVNAIFAGEREVIRVNFGEFIIQ